MKAIILKPHTKQIQLVEDWPDPEISSPYEVKVKISQVGICGTDREEVSGGRADAPKGEEFLVIGHEMVGLIEKVGDKVTKYKKNDPVIITVRRGCKQCDPCKHHRYDLCKTGKYQERGIKEKHGFHCEYVVEDEKFLIPVPIAIQHIAVLTEPTSVVEKAIDEAQQIQKTRLSMNPVEDWLEDKHVLIAGLGPIGLLAAMVLRLRKAKVLGIDIVEPDSIRAQILKELGGEYKKSSEVFVKDFIENHPPIDMIIEAAGIAKLDFDLIELLSNNGIYVLTGVPKNEKSLNVEGGKLMKQLVLKNQVLFGSVNASFEHFHMAVNDLANAEKTWPGVIEKLITHKSPYQDFASLLQGHAPNEIKAVIQWS